MWLKVRLAFRNTFRHRRRTILNLSMIGGGVAMLLVFEGFVQRLVYGLRETTIRTQTGHLQIAKASYWTKSIKNPKDTLIPRYEAVLAEIRKNPHVRYASGRLNFFGLLAKRERNVSAQGVSFDPNIEKSRAKSFHYTSGHTLSSENPYQVTLGFGLSKKIGVKAGDSIVVMTQTYDGVVNAIDMEVSGIFRTAISDFDDNTFLITLKAAQKLLDTKSVESIVVGLDSTSSTLPLRAELTTLLSKSRPELTIQPWYKMAKLYAQVAGFNRVQNRMFQAIILSLVLLSILNTIGMSVFERTAEIGTLRALGESRWGIVLQFILEGMVLGILGGIVGCILGSGLAALINWSQFRVVLPGASAPLTIQVILTWASVKGGAGLAIATSTLAAVIPAIRASRMKVVDALR
ncbi:MAG: ABC transporter permease [Deltaproteobacteria bacterium]|nr:ABC transporter permease [Deltaproteobacteria bacterium]MBI3293978.1 ABC transporter permease [Deltaproteobacteria bacterium]